MNTQEKPVFLRCKEVVARTGLARTTIYAMARAGKFPAPIPLTDSPRPAVAWLESEVDEFLRNRINAARSNAAGCA